MFNVRKSLVVAITVIMMLAMVVPAAMAAPEVLHGVSVVSPTTGAPAFIGWGASGTLYVEFDVAIGGMQVDDVYVKAELIDKHQDLWAWDYTDNVLANQLLNDGVTQYRKPTYTPLDPDDETPLMFNKANLLWLNEGWYDLKVCAMEADAWPETFLWCDTEENALLVDWHAPSVWLDKPGEIWPQVNPANGIWLTGEEYLVGGGQDTWGLKKAEFQYCAISNYITYQDELGQWQWKCGPFDASWIPVSDGTPSGVINEYGGTEYTGWWDTTLVPDDEGVVRICVWDLAGNMNCARSQVFIDNEFSINLRPGWNLISTPTALYDDDIEAVLHHLLELNKVGVVYAYDKCCGWKKFDPGAGPDSLTKIEPGKGYWIWMHGEAGGQLPLTFWGTWKVVGDNLPQSIAVYKGWNLPGYVQWGRPTAPFFPASLAADYLANLMTPIPGVGQGVQALVKYNAVTGVYEAVQYWDRMELGKGYWLASDVDGTIVPAQW